MKKKVLSIVTILLIIFSTINVLANSNQKTKNLKICTESDVLIFKELKIKTEEDFLIVDLSEANSVLSIPGKPMLPVYVKTYTFPFGTKIKDINCTQKNISKIKIKNKIKPASNPVPKLGVRIHGNVNQKTEVLEEKAYSSQKLFPKNPFDYKISCGLKDNKNVLIVNIYFYPVRYSPASDTLYHIKKTEFKVSYQKPIYTESTQDEYDMVIICPNIFKRQLEKLAEHKNEYGVKTTIKTTNSIYVDSKLGKYDIHGRDKPERIKYFIKWAKENWGADYILLVGGRVGQLLKWYIPVRYTNLDDGWESGYISDLYYSDLYKYNNSTEKTMFEDWDSNKNDVFAEYHADLEKSDILDLYPDINIGRLPCRNKKEVGIVVDKIIDYEENTFDKDWFKNFIIVGGDTVPPVRGGKYGYYEADIETRLSASFLKPLGFNITELFISTGNYTKTQDLVNTINKGSGFIHLSGHGNPMLWTNFPPDSEDEDDSVNYSFMNMDMKMLDNHEKLPVCVIGACHSNQFDVCILNILKGIFKEGLIKYFFGEVTSHSGGFKKGEWILRCWGWNMIIQKNGGSIATIGNTGLGFGDSELNCTKRWDGYINTRFFYNYNNLSSKGIKNLGDIHSKTISDYLSNIYVPNISDYGAWMDIKTVEEWTLLGDPSLELGGYPPIH